MKPRLEKLNELIRHQLTQLIMREIEFPANSLVTITKIETSPDIKHCKVYISVLPEKYRGTDLEILNKSSKLLYQQLKKQMTTKFIPNLRFLIDEQPIYAAEIDRLLDEIK